MATKMTMPQLGESVTEGTISRWLVGPGDTVQKYEPIAEVLTDKVSAEIPSSYTGTIEQLLVDENETVAVGVDICTIVEEASSEAEESNKEIKTEQKPNPPAKEQTKAEASQKSRYSPAVVRLAQEHGLDLTTISGSGRGGRITRKDVEAYIAGNHTPEPQQPPAQAKQQEPVRSTPSQAIAAHDQEIPVTGVRKAIAENMVKSKMEVPHAWTMVEVDVTNLVKLRDKKKAAFKEQEGISLTYFPFFMKACVEALKEFPEINAQWNGTTIVRKKDINLSLAVATEDALYVPVIHQADELTIKGLAKKADELAKKARTGKLTGADMQGGTFTLNNTGSFGSILSQPIINSPQAAILSVESIVKRPVVRETEEGDVIAIRHMVNLCLSLDHRVLDGLVCGRFLASMKRRLEQMNEDSTSIY
ncbi:lipoamide acyltransferase component of branched-chain alpha-keto acid dehydrogenase complex [Shouchella clausii]|uniref:Dihydrolipoamide acetyltransferase component of pyruvate dehydrogenase complex n=2 Tax=Bacillaceae TaxID=186817 RepID=A0A268P3M9_SHOCL|nr:branched-chain alpha-keto acid dehydrogenase subunit E2 [Shouchella clausii]PAE90343.1 branched-chain alpha-keto acid dehydrogenase subunit E2 [Shouchella clausii]PAF10250.1 branched-chain alpha-keto acid dehydrogenase subunit E2 [Shouchella clausii]GIN16047.1 lipoamide acyltransferase component of branched-chain alpha-keto acid dehydrogenase complex [Shouchella clausii]SHL16603.1 branched-chain alpha-keto acid dehydrogenase E2 component [Shouchella rhizosphaerae]